MRESIRDEGRGAEAAPAAEPFAPARPGIPLAMLASADVATRGRVLAQLQRSAGNRAVAAALQRDPAPPAAAADTGVIPMLQGFWPDTAWSGGRLAMDLMRPIPALGMLTGFAGDLMAAWDDFAGVPTGDPILTGLNYLLLTVRSGLNIVVNGAQGLLEMNQLLQWAGTALAGGEFLGVVTIPEAILTAIATLGTFVAGEAIGAFLVETDGVLALLDGLIMFQAGIWAQIGPIQADRQKWKDMAWGYLANTLGDIATLPIALGGMGSANFLPSGAAAQAVDSLVALAKYAKLPKAFVVWLLKAFWNVRGGNVLPHMPGLGPAPEQGLDPTDPQPGSSEIGFGELAEAHACYERGDMALGAAASGWAELLEAAAAMGESAAGAPEAVDAIREQLPAYSEALEARIATVEGIAEQLDVEQLDAFSGRVDEFVAGVDALALPLDDAPEELRSALQPLADALESAKPALVEPLRELQATLAELRPQLQLVADAAQESLAIFRDALERVADAAAHCDDMSEFLNDLVAASATLGSGEQPVSIEETLQDWRTLGPDIEAAQAAA